MFATHMLLSVLSVYCLSNKARSLCQFGEVLFLSSNLIDLGPLIRFTQADVREIASHLLNVLLGKIEKAGTPERVAENDYLMKCESNICSPVEFRSLTTCLRCVACHHYSSVDTRDKLRADLATARGYPRCHLQEPQQPELRSIYLREHISFHEVRTPQKDYGLMMLIFFLQIRRFCKSYNTTNF